MKENYSHEDVLPHYTTYHHQREEPNHWLVQVVACASLALVAQIALVPACWSHVQIDKQIGIQRGAKYGREEEQLGCPMHRVPHALYKINARRDVLYYM